MKYRKITAILLGMTMAAASCSTVLAEETETTSAETEASSAETEISSTETEVSSTKTPAEIAAIDSLDLSEMFSETDQDDSWDDTAVQIMLEDSSASAEGSGVQIEGTTVTITEEGTYVLSGDLADGQIVVDAGDAEKVQLVLNGVTVTNDDGACIFVKAADKVILTLAEGSENILSDTGGSYVQPDEGSTVDGVIFSREDLSINGTGSLTVDAGYKHGIVCKDDLAVAGGTTEVTSAEKGIVGEDSVRIKDGTITVTAGEDAVHSDTVGKEGKGFIYIEDGSLTLESGDDGIHAETSLIIAGGKIDVTECREGLEGATIDILDGDIRVTAQDDGLNAAYSSTDSDEETAWNNGGMDPYAYDEEWDDIYSDDTYTYDDTDWLDYMEEYNAAESEWLNAMEDHNAAEYDWLDYMEDYDPDEADWQEYMDDYDYEEMFWEDYYPDDDDMYTPDMSEQDMSGRDMSGQDMSGQNMRGGHGPGGPGGMQGGPGSMQGGPGNMQGGPGGMQGGFGMMDAQEDCYLRISGGTVYVSAGGDGLDTNGYLYLDGGTVIVEGPENDGNGSLDYGIDAVVTGGTLLASGSAGMAEGFGSGSTQAQLYYTFDKNIAAGTELCITNENGEEIFSYTPGKSYQNIIFTSEDLEEGVSYTITAGNASGTAEAGTGTAGSGYMAGGVMPGGRRF